MSGASIANFSSSARGAFAGLSFAVDSPRPRRHSSVPARELHVCRGGYRHLFLGFSKEEQERFGFAAAEGFWPGKDYKDAAANYRMKGRWEVEDTASAEEVNVGPIETQEQANRVRRAIDALRVSDYDRQNVTAPNCVGAVDAVVCIHLGTPPLAPVGKYVAGPSYIEKLRRFIALRIADNFDAGEVASDDEAFE